jgi:hypothetical protein
MRYIKTFESFYWTESKSYFVGYHDDDMQKEIASFLDCPIERIQFDPIYKDTSMFRGYEIGSDPDKEALSALADYMREEKGLEITLIQTVLKDRIYITEKPLEEAYVDWLKANYSGLEAVGSKELFLGRRVLYRYEPGDNILVYDKDSLVVSVRWDLIWSFFTNNFGMKSKGIGAAVEDWLDEAYGLVAVTTEVFHVGTKIATCL